MLNCSLTLASASPRRLQLLEQIGVDCTVQPADIDETPMPQEDPTEYVLRMATAKAAVVAAATNMPVLAADTSVVLGATIFGKPENAEDALNMLTRLAGREHQVLTAVCLVNANYSETILSASTVEFAALTKADIQHYWLSGEPVDKAGSYAIQGLAAQFVKSISGSYSGIMGLPIFETVQLFKRHGLWAT